MDCLQVEYSFTRSFFHFTICGLKRSQLSREPFSSTALRPSIASCVLPEVDSLFGGGGGGTCDSFSSGIAGLLLCFLEGESFRECDDVGGIEMVDDDYVEA